MARNAIVILCFALLLGGCASKLKPVAAHVDSVRVDERTAEGVRVLVMVVAENPNDVALPIVRAKYTVELPGAGAEPFRFTDLPMATIPANGVQTVTLPAALATDTVEAGDYQVRGTLVYEPPGEIRKLLTEYGVPLPSASFKAQGALE